MQSSSKAAGTSSCPPKHSTAPSTPRPSTFEAAGSSSLCYAATAAIPLLSPNPQKTEEARL